MNVRTGEVWFCNTPLEKDNVHQFKFASKSTQVSYFQSVSNLNIQATSYLKYPNNDKIENFISVDIAIESLYNYNYVMFQNTSNGRYYFGFIDTLEYVSPRVTKVHIISDSFQTFQFDITYGSSFIERETPFEDYQNTLSDNVAHGQLIELHSETLHFNGVYLVLCSGDITADDISTKTPRGLKLGDNFVLPIFTMVFKSDETTALQNVLQKISAKGRADRIISCVYAPLWGDLGTDCSFEEYTGTDVGDFKVVTHIPNTYLIKSETWDISSYITGTMKKWTYPYSKIVVEDLTTGQTVEYSPEKFQNGIQFEIRFFISDTPSYRVIPKGYENQTKAYNQSLVVQCKSIIPTINSLYAKYMMMNHPNNIMKLDSAINDFALSGIGAIASKNASMFANGGLNLFGNISNVVMAENQASKLGNAVSSFTDSGQERVECEQGVKISLYGMDVNHEQMADGYWAMFGYPTRRLGTPSFLTNKNYYYCKMINPTITGGIPQEDIDNIKNMFNNGVTIWFNPSNFLVYS